MSDFYRAFFERTQTLPPWIRFLPLALRSLLSQHIGSVLELVSAASPSNVVVMGSVHPDAELLALRDFLGVPIAREDTQVEEDAETGECGDGEVSGDRARDETGTTIPVPGRSRTIHWTAQVISLDSKTFSEKELFDNVERHSLLSYFSDTSGDVYRKLADTQLFLFGPLFNRFLRRCTNTVALNQRVRMLLGNLFDCAPEGSVFLFTDMSMDYAQSSHVQLRDMLNKKHVIIGRPFCHETLVRTNSRSCVYAFYAVKSYAFELSGEFYRRLRLIRANVLQSELFATTQKQQQQQHAEILRNAGLGALLDEIKWTGERVELEQASIQKNLSLILKLSDRGAYVHPEHLEECMKRFELLNWACKYAGRLSIRELDL